MASKNVEGRILVVTYMGATNTKGSRLKVESRYGNMFVAWDHARGNSEEDQLKGKILGVKMIGRIKDKAILSVSDKWNGEVK